MTKRIDKDCCLKHSTGSIKFMWRTAFLLTCFIALSTIGEAQTVTLTLQEDLSSKLPTCVHSGGLHEKDLSRACGHASRAALTSARLDEIGIR